MPTNIAVSRGYHEKTRPRGSGDAVSVADLGPAALLLIAGLIGLFIASLSGTGRNGQYLVIAAPWSTLGQTINLIATAEGGLVNASRFQNIVLAASPRDGFAARARDAGAWLVLPAPTTAGCFGVQTEIQRP